MIDFLLAILNKCWNESKLPSIWKQSIVIPIHKAGRSTEDINHYRPIALTSHIGKLMEKIILNRINHFNTINKIIPENQAGFRKGRCTTEHLIKLTTQIKQQFARRQNILATFFDINKAFDQIWHYRLLQKLKDINLGQRMTGFIQNFLSDRYIRVRIGNTYSNLRKLEMGVPQGSVLSPTLFNIYMADLPTIFAKETEITQFADDICLWQKVTLKRSSKKSSVNYIRKRYQQELDKIQGYLTQNGMSLAINKTKIMLFNSGPDPEPLPPFPIQNTNINYSNKIKFLGVTFTSRLKWFPHFEDLLNKGRKAINLIKVISSQSWGHNTIALRNLAIALVRSKLTYAQEIFFNAPNFMLKKLQSIDCKAFKIALGVPFHTNNLGTYNEMDVLPLDYQRKANAAKFILKSKAIKNFCQNEILLSATTDFAKRGISIKSAQPIRSYALDILDNLPTKGEEIATIQYYSNIPSWEMKKAHFDIDNPILNKSTQPGLLKQLTLEHLYRNYGKHLKIYTDGSKLDNGNAGAAFAIPAHNIIKSFHLGKYYSIFTAELIGILQVLKFIKKSNINSSKVVLCVDSKSALISLNGNFNKHRTNVIFEIQGLINELISAGIDIVFFWIPSHITIFGNEMADKAAKDGAKNTDSATRLNIPLAFHEYKCEIERLVKGQFTQTLKSNKEFYSIHCSNYVPSLNPRVLWQSAIKSRPRNLSSLMCKLRLNALTIKYNNNITCCCKNSLSINHIMKECPKLQDPLKNIKGYDQSLDWILNNRAPLLQIATMLICSEIKYLL